MPRLMSKAAKAEKYDVLVRDLYAHQSYIHAIVNNEAPIATHYAPVDADGGSRTYELFRPTASHGGILVETFYYPGQSRSATVDFFEDWAAKVRALPYGSDAICDIKLAAERLGCAARMACRRGRC